MNSSKIIFLGGIHGVGKGALSKKLISELNLGYLSASNLLKWKNISKGNNKKVANIPNTQEKLLDALSNKCKNNEQYILDGHFCLLNKNGMVEKVSLDIFVKINPILVVVATTDEKLIQQRLEERDKRYYNLDILKNMQKIEKEYAHEIALRLDIPFLEVKNGDCKNLINLISNLG
jgi:adenylate kinase